MLGRVRSYLTEPMFAGTPGMSPEDVARRRALAEALWSQGTGNEPVTSIFGGVNNMLKAFLGGRGMRQAEGSDQFLRGQAEREAEAASQRNRDMLSGLTGPLYPYDGRPTQGNADAQFGAPAAAAPAPQPGDMLRRPEAGSDAVSSGLRLLDQFEGFSAAPYDDWSYRAGTNERYNSGQRIGYGQTIPGLQSITREQAQAQLGQQITTEYIPSIVQTIGPERWSSFTPDQQGTLISLVHNYGSLPGRIVPALQSGDPAAVGQAISGLANDNNGINRNRRTAEAAFWTGGANQQPSGAPTAQNPISPIIRGLINSGDPQGLAMAQTLLQERLAQLAAPPAAPEPFTLGANDVRYDGQGNEIARNPGQPEAGYHVMTPEELDANFIPRPAAGEAPYQMGPNGQISRIGGGGVTINNGTVDERRYALLYRTAQDELPILEQTFASLGNLGNQAAAALPQAIGNFLVSDDYQRALYAAGAIIQAQTYAMTGAAAPEAEAQRLIGLMMPKVGDGPEAIADKWNRIQRAVYNLGMYSDIGAATPGGFTSPQNPGQAIVPPPSTMGGAVAPDGTIVQMPDGTQQIKQGGVWVPYGG